MAIQLANAEAELKQIARQGWMSQESREKLKMFNEYVKDVANAEQEVEEARDSIVEMVDPADIRKAGQAVQDAELRALASEVEARTMLPELHELLYRDRSAEGKRLRQEREKAYNETVKSLCNDGLEKGHAQVVAQDAERVKNANLASESLRDAGERRMNDPKALEYARSLLQAKKLQVASVSE